MLRSRPRRTWAQPATPIDNPRRAADVLRRYVHDEIRRSTQVEWARIAPHCDGGPALDFLEDIACQSDPTDTAGPLVLANRYNGMPTLLSTRLGRPFQGTGGQPVISMAEYVGAAVTGKRFFVDQTGYVFEGRNYSYHAGPGTPPVPNGTWIGSNDGTFPTFATDYSWGTDAHETSDYWRERVILGATSEWIAWYPGSGHSPTWDGYSWYADADDNQWQANPPQGQLGPYLGLSSSTAAGYRDSSAFIAGVEMKIAPGSSFTTYTIGLSTRDPTTLALLEWNALPAVTSWIASEGPASLFSALRSSGRYWRAGISAFPVEDGTFVIHVENSSRAWVVELGADGTGMTVLETVDFTGRDVSGYVTAFYRT